MNIISSDTAWRQSYGLRLDRESVNLSGVLSLHAIPLPQPGASTRSEDTMHTDEMSLPGKLHVIIFQVKSSAVGSKNFLSRA
jgi:hypothetical protein